MSFEQCFRKQNEMPDHFVWIEIIACSLNISFKQLLGVHLGCRISSHRVGDFSWCSAKHLGNNEVWQVQGTQIDVAPFPYGDVLSRFQGGVKEFGSKDTVPDPELL